MSVPYWNSTRDPRAGVWDAMWLGDKKLPGKIQNLKLGVKNSLDIGKAQGNTGAPVTPKGRMPRTISFQMVVNTQEEWDAWDDVLKALNLQGGDVVQRFFSVTHPAAAKLGITSVYIETLDLNQPSVVNGMPIPITLVENIPPKPVKIGAASKKPGPVTDFGSAGFPPPSNALSANQPRRGG